MDIKPHPNHAKHLEILRRMMHDRVCPAAK